MNIVGVSALFHDSACCLVRDGVPVAAVQEERFSRIKNDRSPPARAFAHCLAAHRLTIADIDLLAYYEDPALKAERQDWQRRAAGLDAPAPDPDAPLRRLRQATGWDGEIAVVRHHAAHAASAFYTSGFDRAAVMVLDAVGEWTTASYWRADPEGLRELHTVSLPHSLGLAYSAVTQLLGFAVNEGEYKVMGLRPYGRPTHAAAMARLIRHDGGLDFETDRSWVDVTGAGPLATPALAAALGLDGPRSPTEPLTQAHVDIAVSAQVRLETVLTGLARALAERTGETALCLAGGVALNCAGVAAIRRDGRFRQIYVPPGAGDCGGAMGAALLAARQAGDGPGRRPQRIMQADLGPQPSDGASGVVDALRQLARDGALPDGLVSDLTGDEAALLDRVAEVLAAGGLVGWCQDGMEFGPRALGRRSILADPRRADARPRTNGRVKLREAFRPFAPAVLSERAGAHFGLAEPVAFMTETVPVISSLPLPGVTHADGSARVQCVEADGTRFRRLLEVFAARTGCPVLLNTSFNVDGMPIVANVTDALLCFLQCDLDLLALGDLLLDARAVPADWRRLALARPPDPTADARPPADTYSFF